MNVRLNGCLSHDKHAAGLLEGSVNFFDVKAHKGLTKQFEVSFEILKQRVQSSDNLLNFDVSDCQIMDCRTPLKESNAPRN